MSLQAVRNRYVQDAVSTVAPARLVTMLYDALVKDLLLAENALKTRDVQTSHDRLVHAQEIVLELQSGLDVDLWEGAEGLMSVYHFVYGELVAANVRKNASQVLAVREMIEPLRDAWHQAATGFVS